MELVPVRMLNEFAYCPRLAYLEWVQGEFAHSSDTVDGRMQHRRVDQARGRMPDAAELDPAEQLHASSLMLSAPKVGLIAKIDLLETRGKEVVPIDYKRGKAPDIPEGAYEPERVQVCAQALILEENGYTVPHGVIYFVASKQRVRVELDEPLRARTLALLDQLRGVAAAAAVPPPLEDSPKCPRCSLVGICLPDEVGMLRQLETHAQAREPRRLVPSRDDALPLYVQSAGTRIGKSARELTIETRDGEKHKVRIGDTSHVVAMGAVQLSTQAIHALLDEDVPITYMTAGGWFKGVTRGMTHKNVELRLRQFAAATNPNECLRVAATLVAGKIRNCRTLIRRNAKESDVALMQLKDLVARTNEVTSLESLLGVEGSAARVYFAAYATAIRAPAEKGNGEEGAEGEPGASGFSFDFEGRNRRPPKDPVNALLSLGYAMLTKDLVLLLQAVGFDPYLGFYHQPRYGRPALALDMMEEFRPLVVDSIVLSSINTGVVQAGDFVRRGGAVALTDAGRGRFIRAYERRMDEEVTHPIFGYKLSYRRTIELQARLLGRVLCGELAEYKPFQTR